MNTTMHQSWRMGHIEWLELSVAALAIALLLLAGCRLFSSRYQRQPLVPQTPTLTWQRIPGIEIGGMPFLQWLLVPPLLVWFMRLLFVTSGQRSLLDYLRGLKS